MKRNLQDERTNVKKYKMLPKVFIENWPQISTYFKELEIGFIMQIKGH